VTLGAAILGVFRRIDLSVISCKTKSSSTHPDLVITLLFSLIGKDHLVCPSFKQVIRRDDAIVHPHLQSKIQKSFEDCG
jgi:hypothetical protein